MDYKKKYRPAEIASYSRYVYNEIHRRTNNNTKDSLKSLTKSVEDIPTKDELCNYIFNVINSESNDELKEIIRIETGLDPKAGYDIFFNKAVAIDRFVKGKSKVLKKYHKLAHLIFKVESIHDFLKNETEEYSEVGDDCEYKIPEQIRNAIKNDNLVLFIGPGITKYIKHNETGNSIIPEWPDLKEYIFQCLTFKNDKEKIYFEVDFKEKNKPLKTLSEHIQNKPNDKLRVLLTLEKYLDSKGLDDPNFDLSLPFNLLKLSKKIVTTNFDNLLDKIAIKINSNYNSVVKYYDDNELNLAKLKKKDFIFKLHGCISDVLQIVFFEEDFKSVFQSRILRNENNTLAVLNHLADQICNDDDKTILLVGYDLQKDYLEFVFENELFYLLKPKYRENRVFSICNGFENKATFQKQGISPIEIGKNQMADYIKALRNLKSDRGIRSVEDVSDRIRDNVNVLEEDIRSRKGEQ